MYPAAGFYCYDGGYSDNGNSNLLSLGLQEHSRDSGDYLLIELGPFPVLQHVLVLNLADFIGRQAPKGHQLIETAAKSKDVNLQGSNKSDYKPYMEQKCHILCTKTHALLRMYRKTLKVITCKTALV